MESVAKNSIALRVHVEEAEYVRFAVLEERAKIKRYAWLWGTFGFLIFVGILNYMTAPAGGGGNEGANVFFLFAVPIGFWILYRRNLSSSAKKAYAEIRRIREVSWYRFSPEGLEYQGEYSSAKLTWSQLQRMVEWKEMFVFYLSEGQAYIIPKRWFHSQEQVDGLRQLIRSGMQKKKARLQKGKCRIKFQGSLEDGQGATWLDHEDAADNDSVVQEQEEDGHGLQLRVQLASKERLHFFLWHLYHLRIKRYPWISIPIFAVPLWVIFTADNIKVALFLAFVFLVIVPLNIIRILIKRQSVLDGEEFRYQINELGIQNRSGSTSSKTGWRQFEKVIEAKSFFAFFINSRQAYLLPKRCFQSQEEMESLRHMMKEHLPQEKTEWQVGA